MDMTLQQLAAEIERHDRLYWENHSPEIADSAYDELVEQLRALDPQHPLVNKVETPAVTGKKRTHLRPMLSLGKCYDEAELLKWAKSVSRGPDEVFVCSPKYDGWSCEMPDSDSAVTRGDGLEGEDISHITRDLFIQGYHDFKERGPLYGEVVITKSQFRAAKAVGMIPYKNTRSALGGIIRNTKAPRDWYSLLTLVPFTYFLEKVTLAEMESVDWAGVLEEFAQRDVPTDGAVIALADLEYAESLGSTDHHPRHSIALKHKNPWAVTKLTGVIWQCGKGRISPVAQLEPVEVDGITIAQSSLHNLDYIAQLGIAIGDEVKVGRMGQVIPGVIGLVQAGRSRVEIACTECPACGTLPERVEQNYVCPNPACPGTAGKRLHDSLVRLGVENVGPSTCALLVEAGFDTASKVFLMEKSDWLGLEGFAERSAEQADRQLSLLRSSPIEDFRLLAAMNFEGIGLTMSKKICDKFSLQELPTARLLEIEGVGETTVSKLDFGDSEWQALLLTFPLVTVTKGASVRPTVCFTGADPGGRTREELIKIAEARGYVFARSVTKTLTLLVASETTTTKAMKAARYGTVVESYETFLEGGSEDAEDTD